MQIIATLAVIVALFVIGALARQPEPAKVAAEEASIYGYGDSNKTCQEWTDGCRTCRRSDAGEAVCSNIGIACQPKAVTCEPPK
jgi:hypothetical protein